MRATDIRKALEAGTPLAWNDGSGASRAVQVIVTGEAAGSAGTGRWYIQRVGIPQKTVAGSIAYSRDLLKAWDDYTDEQERLAGLKAREAQRRENDRRDRTQFSERICAAIKEQTGQDWKPEFYGIKRTDHTDLSRPYDPRLSPLQPNTATADLLTALLGLTRDGHPQ